MIYLQTNDKLLTDQRQVTFNFSPCLMKNTPFSIKSLLVFYYYYKEKGNILSN